MHIQIDRIYELAKFFHQNYGDDAWIELFEYLKRVNYEHCYDDFEKLKTLFSKYMSKYGMYRRTNLNKERLTMILRENETYYKNYLLNPSRENYVAAWEKTYFKLKEMKISTSNVMITKILMGFGGRTPALDSKFTNTFLSNPLFPNLGIDYFVERLSSDGYQPLMTKNGYVIPWERVLDMAFWKADGYLSGILET